MITKMMSLSIVLKIHLKRFLKYVLQSLAIQINLDKPLKSLGRMLDIGDYYAEKENAKAFLTSLFEKIKTVYSLSTLETLGKIEELKNNGLEKKEFKFEIITRDRNTHKRNFETVQFVAWFFLDNQERHIGALAQKFEDENYEYVMATSLMDSENKTERTIMEAVIKKQTELMI